MTTIGVQLLAPQYSAHRVLSCGQRRTLVASGCILLASLVTRPAMGIGPSPVTVVRVLFITATMVGLLRAGYVVVTTLGSIRAPILRMAHADMTVPEEQLPMYSVIVPLYREATVLPRLIRELDALDYPRSKLQILLIVEADDHPTRAAIAQQQLGPHFAVVEFPPSLPRNKPKACNLGIEYVTGELCTIYDAEDRPAPDQLRAVATIFRNEPGNVVCIQAELVHWNPRTNWLTAQFAAEYATRYGVTLHALDRFRWPIPLGGNSNHFRVPALLELGAWDSYNMTEDADLGIRIARSGNAVRLLASVTAEEANSRLGNWIRQRSRWRKGFLQTWLVHMRNPRALWRDLGPFGLLSFQLEVGYPVFSGLMSPPLLLLAMTVLLPDRSAWKHTFWSSPLLLFTMVASIIVYLTNTAQLVYACRRHGLRGIGATALTAPLYWILDNIATYKGFFQLLHPRRRHYWELTEHGLIDG